MLQQKLQEELNRFRAINKYGLKMITEQDAPTPDKPEEEPAAGSATGNPMDTPPPGGAPDASATGPMDAPPGGEAPGGSPTDTSGLGGGSTPTPDASGSGGSTPDASGDPLTDTPSPADGGTEEVDVTDLVNMTKNIKKDLEDNKQTHDNTIAKMDDVFTKLSSLETKLGEMDNILAKIDELGSKVQQMKPETPQEKLEMRSLDSYPFNQKPDQFFSKKQEEMKASGKNEYVLTKNDVQNYPQTIKGSFNPESSSVNDFKY